MKLRWFGYAVAFAIGGLTAVAVTELLRPAAGRAHAGDSAATSSSNAARQSGGVKKGAPLSRDVSGTAATFQEFLDMAGQPRGGALYGVKLLELANTLDPNQFPEYATKLLSVQDTYGQRSWATNILFSVWGRHDLDAACQFVLKLPKSQRSERSSAVTGLIDAWPEGDSEGMIQMARQLSVGSPRDRDVRYLLSKAAGADPKGCARSRGGAGTPDGRQLGDPWPLDENRREWRTRMAHAATARSRARKNHLAASDRAHGR